MRPASAESPAQQFRCCPQLRCHTLLKTDTTIQAHDTPNTSSRSFCIIPHPWKFPSRRVFPKHASLRLLIRKNQHHLCGTSHFSPAAYAPSTANCGGNPASRPAFWQFLGNLTPAARLQLFSAPVHTTAYGVITAPACSTNTICQYNLAND